jgi:hypothetical protein
MSYWFIWRIRLEIECNNKTTFLFGKEYAVDYINMFPHNWDFAAFCISGLHPVLKQQYVPLYCKGTTFMKWQLFATAFKQTWHMASFYAQQHRFEYVTSTEVSNSLWSLISNFRPVLNVVCFLLGDSPASVGIVRSRTKATEFSLVTSAKGRSVPIPCRFFRLQCDKATWETEVTSQQSLINKLSFTCCK